MDPTAFEIGCDGPSVLVIGIDGSDTSWRALYYAFGLARRQNSTVVALFAHTPVAAFDGSATTWYAAGELVAELGSSIAELAAEHAVAAEFVSVSRDPVVALTKLADERRADAIIIGASQTFAHRLFGSKAQRTVRRSRCPVIVVP